MRRLRRLASLGVVAVSVTVLAGWQLLAAAGAREPSRAPRASAVRASPAQALESELQRFLATHPVVPPRTPRFPPLRSPGGAVPFPLTPVAPGGATCYVAAGSCSETPCVEFARGAEAAVSAAPSAVVLTLGRTAISAPFNRNAQGPRATTPCQGRLGAPKFLRVSGP